MKKSIVMVLVGIFLVAPRAFAQQKTVTGKVTSEQGSPLAGVSVVIKGTTRSTTTKAEGNYTIAAEAGKVLQFRFIGSGLVERTEGDDSVIDGHLRRVALDHDAVEVTALGEATTRRGIGTAQ